MSQTKAQLLNPLSGEVSSSDIKARYLVLINVSDRGSTYKRCGHC